MIMNAFIDTSIATDAITDSVGEAAGEVIGGTAGSTHYRGMASENNPLANEIFNGAGWKSSGNNIIFANGAAPSDVISFWKSQITSIKKRRDFERRNFAFMVFRPTGESKDFFLFSISGNKTFKHVFEQIPAFPQERPKAFDVFDIPEGHYRGFDTESKLLEHFNNYTDKNVSGTMYLYSERFFCDSCSNVINNFVREFKNIRFIGYMEEFNGNGKSFFLNWGVMPILLCI
ncbi:deaminase domain-containing protein [Edaphovirga cremea]|uniref:deaminase domain-containing protein n=1 Tax=Edaphovirga cremea TaxID=2267246 RepID=UPI000DEF4A0F|nr:deaminase domain-containing protein [Edaphovirga cremea]